MFIIKKIITSILPLIILAMLCSNCSSDSVRSLFGPEVVIGLGGEVIYKAVDPSFSSACLEIQLPLDFEPDDVKDELVNHLKANITDTIQAGMTLLGFSLDKLVVSYGACPLENIDVMPASCSDKRIDEMPVEHNYKLVTYNGFADYIDPGFPPYVPEIHVVPEICNSL